MPKVHDTVEEFWDLSLLKLAEECANDSSIDNFKLALSNYLGVNSKKLVLAPSGRTALEILLRSHKHTNKKVLVAAYNCGVISEAILNANYEVQFYDFSPTPGFFDWKEVIRLMDDDVSIIIVTHYFGVPIDFQEIVEFCKRRNITIIEDCAHTLGGKIRESIAGTIGDASIFSFNYDKPISLGWGGAYLINSGCKFNTTGDLDISWEVPNIQAEMNLLTQFTNKMSLRRKNIIKPNTFLRRLLLRIKLIREPTHFTVEAGVSVGSVQSELGILCLKKYKEVMIVRNDNANNFAQFYKDKTWPVGKYVEPSWLKQKLFCKYYSKISKNSKLCQAKGVRLGNFNWPKLICDNNKEFKISTIAASNWIDVPIHQNMSNAAMNIIKEVFPND